MKEPNYKLHLLNLLARIHRDGGDYAYIHGVEQASKDADEIVAKLHSDADIFRRNHDRSTRD